MYVLNVCLLSNYSDNMPGVLSLSLADRERPFNCQCNVMPFREKDNFLQRHRGGGARHCQNRMQVTSYRGKASNQIYTPSASVLFGPNRQYSLLNMSGKVWLCWKITDTVIVLNPDSTLLCVELLVLLFVHTVILVSLTLSVWNQPAPSSLHLIYQMEEPSCSAAVWFATLPRSCYPSSLRPTASHV